MDKRERIVGLVKHKLLRKGSPRLIVSVILLATGLAGFLVSFLLLRSGMTRMWLRYPLAIIFAYCVFLLLLRLWLYLQRSKGGGLDLNDFEPPEIHQPDSSSPLLDFRFSGGGGDASGAGAGGSWGQSVSSSSSSSSQLASGGSSTSGGSSSSGGGDGGGFDLDEGAAVVVVVVAVAAALVAIFYVIYAAPVLLAEILVDGALVTGLYTKLKGVEQRHWLRAAVRRTLLPALIAALFFSIAGYALQKAAPKARSVGEAWRYLMKDED